MGNRSSLGKLALVAHESGATHSPPLNHSSVHAIHQARVQPEIPERSKDIGSTVAKNISQGVRNHNDGPVEATRGV